MAKHTYTFVGQRLQVGRTDWEYVSQSQSRADLENSSWWVRAQELCPTATYRIVERRSIEHEDGDVIRAELLHTVSNDDGIDRVVGTSAVRGVVRIADGLVSLNHPDDPQRDAASGYVAMRPITIDGINSVLRNVRLEA